MPWGELDALRGHQIEERVVPRRHSLVNGLDHRFVLLRPGDGPVFIHCRRGKDRTGTVIACYRMQHDGWNNAKAQAEANEFGMSHLERGPKRRFPPLGSKRGTNGLNQRQLGER